MEALFDEATFKINVDFNLTISLWYYEKDLGWKAYEGEMSIGTDNYIKVLKIYKPKIVFQLIYLSVHDFSLFNTLKYLL